MSKRTQKQNTPSLDELTAMMHEVAPAQNRRRRVMVWCITLAAALLLLVLLVPTILTQTSVREYLLAKLIPADTAIVSMKSMSVGWFAPLEIEGLRVLDAQGLPLFEAERIAGDRSIIDFAKDYTEVGSIVVTAPVVHLSLRPDGSNFEDTIAKLAGEQNESTTSSSVAVQLKIVDARIIATEAGTKATWQIEQLNAEVKLPKPAEEDWQVSANGQLDGQPFSLESETPLGLATEAWPLGPTGSLALELDALSLAPLRYAALRAGLPIEQISGVLSLNVAINWLPDDVSAIPKLAATAEVRTENLQLVSTELLGRDVLRLANGRFRTKAQVAKDQLTLEQCDLESDFGRAALTTTASLSKLMDPAAMVEAIRQQQLNTSGQVDVAALARALPNTLKIRDDVQIASGRVTWSMQSQVASLTPTRWTGSLQTEDVQILRSGRPIDWKFPLEVNFSAIDGAEIEIENVTARSDFFALAGKGKLRSGSLQAQADLERLFYELGQVIDINDIYVRGGMQSFVQWSETQPNQLKLDARTELAQFVMTQNERVVCQEDKLTTVAVATATLDGQNIISVDDGRLDVVSAGDFFAAELQKPVVNPIDAQATWPVVCRLKGDLATWFARVKPFGLGLEWQVGGEIDVTTQVSANQGGVAVQSFVADVRNLAAASDGILVTEPIVQVKTVGTVDLNTFACRFPSTTVSSQSFALSANEVSVDMEPHFVVAGDIGYRADIARLMAYMPSEQTAAPRQQISGDASGRLQLQARQQITNFQLSGAVDDLQVKQLGLPEPLWQEPKLTINATGAYDALQDQLQLSGAQIVGKVLSLVAQGSASQLSSEPAIDVSGEYGYDLEGLTAIFGDTLGPDIQLTGNQRQQFVVRGPLFPATASAKNRVSNDLVARIGAGWDSANVYNTQLGLAQVDANLANGVLHITPLKISVGEGRLQIAPTLHVNTEPLWMTIEPQTVADQIRITPEMTSNWMKYVAPLLADATNAEGTFSVSLAKAEIPLMQPMDGRIDGEFVIHGGALGPGPLATQFIELASQIKRLVGKGESKVMNSTKTWVELAEQHVAFQVAENRVYHEGFQMIIDGVLIRTRGSVGMLDESISVMAEVPIMDEWIDGTPALAGLKGQVISVPVGGTTSNPKLDQRALAQVSTQLARSAATGFIQEKLGTKLQEKLGSELGGGSIDEAIGGAQEKLNNKIQNELGRQLNKFFK